jgi:hypothetical protein
VCAGALKQKGGGHRCSFTVVEREWAWQASPVHDEIRWIDDKTMNTITIVLSRPGLTLTQVESKLDSNGHRRTGMSSWRIEDGRLIGTASASVIPSDHRR